MTPEQQKRWRDKTESGGPGTVVNDGKPRYYRRSGGNVYRVQNHEYAYLDHQSGTWVPHPAVTDAVTGIGGAANVREITPEQAQALIRRVTGRGKPGG